jgi:hypothetical protein
MTSHLSLLGIPLDIRYQIYELLIPGDQIIYADPTITSLPISEGSITCSYRQTYNSSLRDRNAWAVEQDSPIFLVCKQMYREALPLIHSRVPLMLDYRYMTSPSEVDKMLVCIRPEHLSQAQHLIIDWRDKFCAPIAESNQLHAVKALPALRSVSILAHYNFHKARPTRQITPTLAISNVALQPDEFAAWFRDGDVREELTRYAATLWRQYRDGVVGPAFNGQNRRIKLSMTIELGFFHARISRAKEDLRALHENTTYRDGVSITYVPFQWRPEFTGSLVVRFDEIAVPDTWLTA